MASDESTEAASDEAEAHTGQSAKDETQTAGGSAGDAKLPAIDFSTFILSLSTTALYQMGLVPEPGSGRTIEPDRVIAQQTIDTLEMLHVKTRGNLDEEEAKLFDSLLYELRVRFVELGE